ncbi:4-hydroxy-tetrahydrodipicolinate synthase [bacterium]|jgi:4-hydroxy-tetrahydrodipicolinate synthase|nr:4-hydroxy-tetrahydrodipicolinate synthase [bacterium]
MSTPLEFGQLMTAMITPFTSAGELDVDLACEVADYLIENGTDTIILAGTTGESPTLTHDEEYLLFERVIKSVGTKAKIMVGTGSNSTRTAIEATQKAESLGAHGSLQVVPYYNKPSQEGMYQHFKAIAENTSLPILLYNIPGRTGANMEPETIARLADISNIIGVKEAAGSVDQVKKIRAATPTDFLIYSGDDGLTLPFIEAGAIGVVSVASHIAGKQIKTLIQSALSGDMEKAKQIQSELESLFNVLFVSTNPGPIKAAMRLLGFSVGIPRLPLVDITEDEYRQIEVVLDDLLIS